MSIRPAWHRAWHLLWLAGTALAAHAGNPAGEGFALALRLERGLDTRLIDVQTSTEQSRKVRALRSQRYELAQGQTVGMDHWYRPRWPDTVVSFLTPLSPDTGIIWGFSTGERGPKYRIAPSAHMGLLHRARWGPRTSLTLQATVQLGGRLKEKTCTADYGEIGGVQTVNCRLAATELAPADTLAYLLDSLPPDRTRITLSFSHDF